MTHDTVWSAFTDQLAHSLLDLEDGDALIVGISEDDAEAPYVQVTVYDETMVRGEVSSNTFLPQEHQLTGPQMDRLVALGWRAPMPELDAGSPNFFIDSPLADVSAIATMTVATLREVFTVHHPSELDLSGAEVLAEIDYGATDLRQADTRTFGQDGHYVDVTMGSDGSICFRGQTLSSDSEYEYALTVSAADVPKVVAALGGESGCDVISLVAANYSRIRASGERSWLESIGIEPGFWNHFSFDSD
jgi:hypothetical protein